MTVVKEGDENIFRDVCSYILITELCERLAFYGLTGSLSIFLTRELGIASLTASELGNTFSAVNYLSPLAGAYLAETVWGRYKTILVFCSIYCVGMVLCTISAHPEVRSAPLFFFGLFACVALGSGGIKPNVVVLGADQFDPEIPTEKAQMESYFNYFYWSINIGATFSFGFLAYLAVNGMGAIPQSYGFFVSFTIPTVAMAVAIWVFTLGSSKYVKKTPKGSALSTFTMVVLQAARSSRTGQVVVLGAAAQIPGMLIVILSFFLPKGGELAFLGLFLIVSGIMALVICGQSADWLDGARYGNGGTFMDEEVDDAADVVLLSPYFGFMVMFSCVYSQMSTTFVLQGCQMDLRVGKNGEEMISSAQLSLFDCVIVLLLIPVFDSFIYPKLSEAGCSVTPLRKIGCGYVFSLLSMLLAAFVEIARKDSAILGVESNCDSVDMSEMSVWWQTPQYVLVGISEILIAIAGMDLFYSQAPDSMRSVCQAMNLLTQTAGNMVSAGLLSIMGKWFTTDLNNGHLEYIYLVFCVLIVVNLVWFIQVSKTFVYKEDRIYNHVRKISDSASAGRSKDDQETTVNDISTLYSPDPVDNLNAESESLIQ